jgi:muramidase (phage lysozyme)
MAQNSNDSADGDNTQNDQPPRSSAAELIAVLEADAPTLFQTEDGLVSRPQGKEFYENGKFRADHNRAAASHFRPHAKTDFSELLGKAGSEETIRGTLKKLTGHDPTLAQINNTRGWLDMTAVSEGTIGRGNNGYNMIVGGSHGSEFINDYTHHPEKMVTVRPGLVSSAAGRYQFLGRTYRGLGLPDFSPASQDAGALMLVKGNGALEDVMDGRFETAIHKTRGIWASFPGAGYGQHENAMSKLTSVAEQAANKYQGQHDAPPVAANDDLKTRGQLPAYTSRKAVETLNAASDNAPKPSSAKTLDEEKLADKSTGKQTVLTPTNKVSGPFAGGPKGGVFPVPKGPFDMGLPG